jgi:hypothetical protein
LLAVLSLAWPWLAGLGALPALVLSARTPRTGDDNLRLLAAVWSFGLCLNYAMLLFLGQLGLVLAGELVLILGLGIAAIWRCRERFAQPERWRPWLIALGVLVAGSAAIILDPLTDWDARSIWFFHGKMIFYGGGLTRETGLDLPGVPHARYPMLVPGLAGQIAGVVGFWNEYLPKFSLALLLPVPIIVVLMLRRTPISMALAILAFTMVTNQFLYSGSMDGYLALYAAAAAFFLADWLDGGGDAAFLAALGALGVVGGLKVEGQVVYLALGAALVLLAMRRKLVLPRPSVGALALAALPFVGFVLWHFLADRWGLRDVNFTLAHAWARLSDPSALWLIFRFLILHPRFYVVGLGVLAILGLARLRAGALPAAAQLPLLAGVFYLGAIYIVFASTPDDLRWQLATAAGRVVRSATEMLAIGGIWVLRELERGPMRWRPAQQDPAGTLNAGKGAGLPDGRP